MSSKKNERKYIKCCNNGGKVNKKCVFKLCKKCCLTIKSYELCKVHKKNIINNNKYDNDILEEFKMASLMSNINNKDSNFDKYVKKIENDIETILSIMTSTDFDKRSGLNETGFKMIVLSSINKFYNGKKSESIIYRSEYPILSKMITSKKTKKLNDKYEKWGSKRTTNKTFGSIKYNKFIDLVVETSKNIIIIEMKYIRLPWIKNLIDKNNPIKQNEIRVMLSLKGEILKNKRKKDLLKLKNYSGATIEQILSNAKEQLDTYINLVSKNLLMSGNKKKIIGYICVGIGNRCFLKKTNK